MITTGVIYIKTLLMELQVLNIDGNQFGNDGVAAVCEGLHNNTNITKLRVNNCGISVEGILHVTSYVVLLAVKCFALIVKVLHLHSIAI